MSDLARPVRTDGGLRIGIRERAYRRVTDPKVNTPVTTATAPQTPTAIFWFDIEATGLDLHRDAILEIGGILTDSDLNVLGRYQTLVRPPEDLIPRLEAQPVVLAMHERSGLLHELLRAPRPLMRDLAQVDADVVAFLDEHTPGHQIVLAGSGVERFDRRLIEAQMPALHDRLPYWCIDVSTDRRGFHIATGDDLVPPSAVAHRVMADVEDAIRVARQIWAMYRDRSSNAIATDIESTPTDRVLAGLGLIEAFREHEVFETDLGEAYRADTAEAMTDLLGIMSSLDSVAGLMDAGTLLLETAAHVTGKTPAQVVEQLRMQVLREAR